MLRSYNRKRNGTDDSAETVNAAVQDDGHSLREGQEQFRVNYRTLSRCIRVRQTNPAIKYVSRICNARKSTFR